MTGGDESPRALLIGALALPSYRPGMPMGEGAGVALLRTAALHLYAWRESETLNGGVKFPLSPGAAAKETIDNRASDERQAEALLARALELEPFHVPTLSALAFTLLQRSTSRGAGPGCTMARAEGLLEKAVEYGGRRGVCPAACGHFVR